MIIPKDEYNIQLLHMSKNLQHNLFTPCVFYQGINE